jgi:DHA2 family multidrug resistance protein-like MFS transporter
VPWSLAFVVGSLLAPRLARHFAPAAVLVWGLAVAATGFAALMFVDGRFALAVLVASTVVMSLGLAPVFTIGNEMIITAAPPERAGAASAISETSSELSGALGIALLGSVGMVFYRATLGASLPEGLDAALAAQAMPTLGGALAAASGLPAPAGEAMATAARGAFVDALQIIALASAGIVALAAIVAARILRATPTVTAAKAAAG